MAVALLRGNDNAYWPPRPLHPLDIFFGHLTAFIQDRKGHHVEVNLDVTHLFNFQHPTFKAARSCATARSLRVLDVER